MTGPGRAGATELIASRYRLLRPLESGAASDVFVARDEILARDVAVEILRADLARDAEACERFRRTAVRAGRVSHPNVIALFDTGETDGRPFLVTELPAGRSVSALLAADGAFDPDTAISISSQVANALAHMHAAGVVHGDVTVDAVLVDWSRHPAPPTVKIAPPRAGGDGAAPDADICALGRVLFEMVTARRLAAEPVPPSTLRPDVPRDVDEVVLRACRREFGSMSDLRAHLLDLGPVDDAVPAVKRDPTPPQGGPATPSFAQTERSWLVPTALVLVAAVTLAVVGMTLAQSGLGRDLLPRAERRRPVPVAAVVPFDPEGDGEENNEMSLAVVDGDPGTVWRTDRYRTREFGNLKDGLGLVVETADGGGERRLVIETPTPGWAATVHAAPTVGSGLPAWGPPVAEIAAAGEAEEVVIPEGGGRFLLVWFTRLPPSGRVEIATIRVEA